MQFYGQSDRPYIPLDEVARVLRVSKWTLYRNLEDIPHIRVGGWISISCQFLFLEPPVVVVAGKRHQPFHYFQPFLPFDMPQDGRRWRNSHRLLPGNKHSRLERERVEAEHQARSASRKPQEPI